MNSYLHTTATISTKTSITAKMKTASTVSRLNSSISKGISSVVKFASGSLMPSISSQVYHLSVPGGRLSCRELVQMMCSQRDQTKKVLQRRAGSLPLSCESAHTKKPFATSRTTFQKYNSSQVSFSSNYFHPLTQIPYLTYLKSLQSFKLPCDI